MNVGTRTRRTFVTLGVVAAVIGGLASIEVAANLTLAAAPPPAPPVSIDALQTALAAEQARNADLQAQLDELTGLTTSLSDALGNTKVQISVEGESASTLARQLKAAQGKLAQLKALLATARQRLLAAGKTRAAAAARDTSGGGSNKHPAGNAGGGSSGGGGGGGGSGGGGTSAMSLTLTSDGSGVIVDWTACNVPRFAGYAVVRSTDGEIHWPPEDRDTEIARIGAVSTTRVRDPGAPSGTMTYRVWCLETTDGETKGVTSTPAKSIRVP